MGGSGGGVGSLVDVVVQLVGAPVRANFSMLSSSSILSFSSTDLISLQFETISIQGRLVDVQPQ